MRALIGLTLLLTHLLAPTWVSAQKTPEAKAQSPRTDAFGDPLPSNALARLGTTRLRHGEAVQALAYSPDGKTLATGCSDGPLRLWDAVTGKLIQQYPTEGRHHLQIQALAYVPNTDILAWREADRVTFWNRITGKVLRLLQPEDGGSNLAFTPDGKFLVTAGFGIRLWDMATGKNIHDFANLRDSVSCLAITPDGKTLAANFAFPNEERLLVLDVATGKAVRTLASGHHLGYALAFSADGKTLASGGLGEVHCWDLETSKKVRVLKGHQHAVHRLAFSPDRKILASGGGGGNDSILLWDAVTGVKLHTRDLEGVPVDALVFAPDSKTLAVGCRTGAIRLWDVATGRERFQERGHQNQISALEFSPNGKLLASVAGERVVRLWEPTTGRELRQLKGHRSVVTVAFHPDGQFIATAGLWDFIRGWRVSDGTPIFRVGEEGYVYTTALAFSPDGKTLAAGGVAALQRWDVGSGAKLKQLEGHPGPIHSLAYSPDGRFLASTTGSSRNQGAFLRVSNAISGKQLHVFSEDVQDAFFCRAVFAADGRLLLARNSQGKVRCWELTTGKPRPLLGKEHPRCHVLDISPDGRTLATADAGILYLWEVATGKERARFAGHAEKITALAFSADGRMLASGCADSSILVWDLTGWQRQPPRHHLSAQEVQALWQELHKPAFSFQTLWQLVASPKSVVPFLREHIRPISPLSAQRFQQLLADLGSSRFAVRQQATRELEQLAEIAVPALRRALQEPLALETRRRVERILEKQTWESASDQLRMLRTLEVLEQQNTPEARQLLRELSQGAPEARLSQQAKSSRERLAKRSPAP